MMLGLLKDVLGRGRCVFKKVKSWWPDRWFAFAFSASEDLRTMFGDWGL